MLYNHMATWNLDQDVVRWGLHQLLDCTLSSDCSRSTVTGYEHDFSQVECVREGYLEPCYVQNDEVIARALQEELSRLASVEAAGVANYGDSPLQASILAQDWLGPSKRHNDVESNAALPVGLENIPVAVNDCGRQMDTTYNYGDSPLQASILAQDWLGPSKRHNDLESNAALSVGLENIPVAVNDCGRQMDTTYDCRNNENENECSQTNGNEEAHEHSEGEHSLNGEDLLHSLDILDGYALDGEVGRRLNQMVPVPHIPKTNEKIPTVDEEISDHQRLLERLQLYDLVESKVQGDGNCQFRALSDQLYRSSDYHGLVRDQIIQQLKSHPEIYEGYVLMGYVDYIKKMSKSGEWGDHVTLQAAADSYGVKIFVITSFKDTCYIEILPHISKSSRVICLSFWAEVHYNSIYPEGELPPPCLRKKKKWWNF